MAAFAWMVLLTVLLWAVGVVISFKLFWHLCSPEGCEEFGVPPISAPTVMASAGAWLGLAFINIVSTGGGQFMYELAVAGASRDAEQEARRAELHEFDRQQALREQEAGAQLSASRARRRLPRASKQRRPKMRWLPEAAGKAAEAVEEPMRRPGPREAAPDAAPEAEPEANRTNRR